MISNAYLKIYENFKIFRLIFLYILCYYYFINKKKKMFSETNKRFKKNKFDILKTDPQCDNPIF